MYVVVRRGGSLWRSGIVAAVMPPVFWIGLGIAGFVFLVGVIAGARSRTASLASGAAIGAYLGVMCAFPLLAIGLATS
jgi:ABC-type transport system involved in multi-copper enzyme maturation permease subunit